MERRGGIAVSSLTCKYFSKTHWTAEAINGKKFFYSDMQITQHKIEERSVTSSRTKEMDILLQNDHLQDYWSRWLFLKGSSCRDESQESRHYHEDVNDCNGDCIKMTSISQSDIRDCEMREDNVGGFDILASIHRLEEYYSPKSMQEYKSKCREG